MTAHDSGRSGADATESSQRLIDMGNRLEDAGDIAAALAKYQDAVAASPANLRAYLNLGNALQRLGRIAEAVAALQSALRIDPDYAPGHFNLGNVYLGTSNFDSAEHEFRECLRLDPALAEATIALANVLETLRRPIEAEQHLRQVLADKPDCAPAAYNLGLLLQRRDDCDQAEEFFRRAIAADPSFVTAYTALGDLIRNAGRAKDAEAWYRKALAADPGSQAAWDSMLLSLNYRDDLGAPEVLAEHLRFGAAFPEDDSVRRERKGRGRRHPRVRIAYLSGDFIQHPVALFLRPVLMHHDRTQFEVFCYSNNMKEDGMTRDLRSRVDHFRNIADANDAAGAQIIRADEPDVLIDLSGHTPRSRVHLFNHGCAPVQATWLGYLNTTGLRSADFRICDAHTDPIGMTERFHTEQLLRMPDSQWCYAPVFEIPGAPIPQRGANNGTVFGSFNHASKLSDRCIELWCRVLLSAPGSRLRMFAVPPGRGTAALRQRFERHGIDRRRVSFQPRMNIDDYFAAIADVDVALDTFPYGGGTTSFDVLWMGVPLVALADERPVSRSGISILSNLQLPELIAGTDDAYVETNLRLAADAQWRRTLRETLRDTMRLSPLMDAARFTRNLETGIRQMLDNVRP